MRTIRILLVVFFVASFIVQPSTCFAQLTLGEVINRTPTQSVPFDATKRTGTPAEYSFGIANTNNAIPDRMYENIQLTQYFNASSSSDFSPTFFRKFNIPNSTNKLIAVSFGGVTDWGTDVLCVVTPSGQILGTLECAVMFYPYIPIKQFRINAQNQIIVTTLKPTSTTSIPLRDFTSFNGYRQDITYEVNAQGSFVQISVQNYKPRTYTRAALEYDLMNLWHGNDVPE